MLRGGVLPSVAVGVSPCAVVSAVQGALGAAGSAARRRPRRGQCRVDHAVPAAHGGPGPAGGLPRRDGRATSSWSACWMSSCSSSATPTGCRRWPSRSTAILVSLAGTTGEIVAFTRVRSYVFDDRQPGCGRDRRSRRCPSPVRTHQMVAGRHLREGWSPGLPVVGDAGLRAAGLAGSSEARSVPGSLHRGPGPGDGHWIATIWSVTLTAAREGRHADPARGGASGPQYASHPRSARRRPE